MFVQTSTTTQPIQHKALAFAVKTARFPGAWTEWDGHQQLDTFLLELHDRPAEYVKDPFGRNSGRWQAPGMDALRALPFLYQGATQYLLARFALNHMGLGEDVEPISVARDLHDRLDTFRSVFAAYGWNRVDGDFSEATTRVEVAESKPWQDVGDTMADPTVEAAAMTVGCSLEEAMDTFVEEITANDGNKPTNAQFQVINVAAREHIEDRHFDGWVEPVMDDMSDDPARTAKEKRAHLKEQLDAEGIKKFFGTNKVYRGLVKIHRRLSKTIDQLHQDLERATAYAQRPSSEQYAGSDEGMLMQLGRVDHWLASNDTTGLDGFDPGERFQEAIRIANNELGDLDDLLEDMEDEQRRLNPVWKMLNRRGAPYWYANVGEFYTIDEKEEASNRRAELRDQWIAARPMELKKQLDSKALNMLAELSNFDNQ
ncbi:hypothetical protein [Vreelandella jeotgali]|uniref:hypothetical protein n=1 Tax=Vreelandella jeotgali TaxID=553386 RepID=UPI00034D8AD6|nr:hypothetical protein [Halomonas jeotgali]